MDPDDPFAQSICRAFEVTPDEVDELDRAMGFPQLRAIERAYEEALPGRARAVAEGIDRACHEAGLLPPGVRFESTL